MPFPFLIDWNNPTALAPKPSQGTKINWIDEPANPGLKPIIDQFTDEFKSLALNMDASVAGRGLQFGNIANSAIRPENMRTQNNKSVQNKPWVLTDTPATGNYFTQLDGQTQKYVELTKWQEATNFRNFQPGIDNVTTDMKVEIDWDWADFYSGISQWGVPSWHLNPSNYNDYKNMWIRVEVSPDLLFTTSTIVEEKGFFARGAGAQATPWIFNVIDKTIKIYQNPCYKISFFWKKSISQSAGTQALIRGQGTISVTANCTNKNI
jgi:hypothetical protein